jgi:hypothetical protein
MRVGKVLVGLVLLACAWLCGSGRPASAAAAHAAGGLVRTGTGTFSIDVEGADIRTVLRAIAEFSGRNIVVGKDVKARSGRAQNVGWQDALRTDPAQQRARLRRGRRHPPRRRARKLATESVERETARREALELRRSRPASSSSTTRTPPSSRVAPASLTRAARSRSRSARTR